MTNTDGRIAVGREELAAPNDARAREPGARRISEADMRELAAYGIDSDHRTLVGLGPVERARRSRPTAEVPESQRMPQSEAPGPFIADDEVPRSFRGRRVGAWALAVPALLVAAATAAVVVRSLPAGEKAASKASVAVGATQATAGLTVKLEGVSAHILVDGVDRGSPPLRLLGLEPGSHVVSVTDPAYAPYSQPVLLTANQVSNLEPVLSFVRGVIRLGAGDGAADAEVEVVGANERRQIQHLPARLEVEPGEYRIRATRKGYAPFESRAVLSSARPEVDLSVVLERRTPSAAGDAPLPPPGTSGPNAGAGSLDITSSPPANVVVDGRPLGLAPRVVQVPPGLHSVVLIHPKLGRQSLSVKVAPGQVSRASAEF